MAPLNPAYLHVHLTGFGPFGDYETNPSWEAVAPLEGSILTSKPAWPVPGLDGAREVSSGESHGDTGTATRTGTAIKLSTSRIPVTYSAATRLVKAIHAGHGGSAQEDVGSITDYTTSSARSSDPPDIVIHVGVGLPHGLKLETRARRWGYDKPGSDGRLAPEDPADDDADSELAPRRRRGLVGKEWDAVPDELRTLVPTGRVVERLRAEAIKIDESDDAGLYLCEFTFYTSLATARLKADGGSESRKPVPVQFIHVPPIGKPYTVEELSQAIRLIIWTIVNGDVP